MASYAQSLESLWEVQAVDALVVDSRKRISSAERAIAKANEKVANAEASLQEAHDTLQHMRAKEKEQEDELARLDARVKQLEAQGTEAGNAAAAKQRAKIDEIETAGIELLGEIQAQAAVKETRRAELDSQRKVSESEKEIAQETIEQERANLEKYAAMRESALQNVVPKLFEVYEGVNERRPGDALARVQGTYCGGCNGELTMHLIQQVKQRAEIIRCPICARILDIEKT